MDHTPLGIIVQVFWRKNPQVDINFRKNSLYLWPTFIKFFFIETQACIGGNLGLVSVLF